MKTSPWYGWVYVPECTGLCLGYQWRVLRVVCSRVYWPVPRVLVKGAQGRWGSWLTRLLSASSKRLARGAGGDTLIPLKTSDIKAWVLPLLLITALMGWGAGWRLGIWMKHPTGSRWVSMSFISGCIFMPISSGLEKTYQKSEWIKPPCGGEN